MATRKLSQVSTNNDEDAAKASSSDNDDYHRRNLPDQSLKRRRKKFLRVAYDDDDEEEEEEVVERRRIEKDKNEGEDEEVEPVQGVAKPIGDVIRVSGQRKYYKEFEFNGNRFQLEDSVLLAPKDINQKPYVAIIKDIAQSKDGSMMVSGQLFYRPEEAEKKGGGGWQAIDTRELFYSFHRDEVPAESVMHKCVVYFVPLNKQLPSCKQHPGFIIQMVYDTIEKKLWKLTDKDYDDGGQEEIDVLVLKTLSCLGELHGVENEGPPIQLEENIRNKRLLQKMHVSLLDMSREDEKTPRSNQTPRGETPGSCADKGSDYYIILAEAKALTKEARRDKSLEKLLEAVEYVCWDHSNDELGPREEGVKDHNNLTWPNSAVSAVVALEKAIHESIPSDYAKYNQKIRSLISKLQRSLLLAHRLLSEELEPAKILSMSSMELKEGLTEEEIASNHRKKTQGVMISAQHMVKLAGEKMYIRFVERDDEDRITHIFMAHPESVKLYQTYHGVVIVDSNSRTNKYNLPFLQFIGMTPVGMYFVIAYVILEVETEACYSWAFTQLKKLLVDRIIPNAIITNCELDLIKALEKVFNESTLLLCNWHVNKVMLEIIQKFYGQGKGRVIFNMYWYKITGSVTEEELDKHWYKFINQTPKLIDPKTGIHYLNKIWLKYHRKFMKGYTKRVMHYGNTTTSRTRALHVLLRNWLTNPQLSLATLFQHFNCWLSGQVVEIRYKLEKSRSSHLHEMNTQLYLMLKCNVSHKAVILMIEEFERGTTLGIGLEQQCGCAMRRTHGLPCACKLHDLFARGDGVLLKDVDTFWRKMIYCGTPIQELAHLRDMFKVVEDGV